MAPGLMRLAALGVVLGDEARSAIDDRLPPAQIGVRVLDESYGD